MSAERLLLDVFVLLEACLTAGEADDLDDLAERLIDRLITKVGATSGLLYVREPMTRPQGLAHRFVSFPAHRARLLGAERDDARIEAAIAGGRAARVDPSACALIDATGIAAVLSVPIAPMALLELHAREPGALDDHTARVLGSLAPWLGARIRAASRERETHALAQHARDEWLALDALVARLPGVVWRADTEGRPTFISSRAVDILGLPEAALSGAQHPRALGIHEGDRARIQGEINSAMAARRPEISITYRYQRAGAVRDLEERIALSYDPTGAPSGALSFVADVTTARAAVRRIEELEAQRTAGARADALRVDAERASKAKTEFLNLLSHELRAPLFPIIALSDLLLRTDDTRLKPNEWREQIRMINGAGKQMLQLVGDLLDISRVDAGRARPNPGPIALPHFIAALTDRGLERARARGTQLSVSLAPGGAGTDVFTERSVLERIATSLIAHAVENLESREVKVELIALPNHIVVRVTAVAPAPEHIPEDLDEVFEPFWERPAESRAESRGQGLALALVRRMATAYGGRVRAQITAERRTFEAELPCAYAGPPLPFVKPPRAAFGSAELGAIFGAVLWVQSMGVDVALLGSAADVAEELKKRQLDLLFVDARLPGLRLLEDLLHAERAAGRLRPYVVALVRPGDPVALSGAVADQTLALPATRERIATMLARF